MTIDSSELFDMAVIGGGIAGAAVARDASLRGARVILLEKNTFGSGTSSKSSKLIHGGIRYLELAWQAIKFGNLREFWKNFGFVFSSLRESGILHRIAPDLVVPHPIWIPIYSSAKRSKWMVFAGALLYGFLAEISGNLRSPKIYFSPEAILKEIPGLNPKGLQGGVKIWDHVTDDLLLVNAVMASAKKNGAQCHEHAEVLSYRLDSSENLYGLRVRQDEKERTVKARKIINASGPWVDILRMRGQEGGKKFIFPVAGSHINVKSFLPHSVLLEAKDGRIFFVIHRGDTSRIGTTERVITDPDTVTATEDEINYLLESVSTYFPAVKLQRKDVLSSDAGVRPLAAPAFTTEANRVSREHEIRVGPTGVIHLLGVKLTDHRRAAEKVVDRLVPSLSTFHPNLKKKSCTATQSLG